jgi:hypothetical protein
MSEPLRPRAADQLGRGTKCDDQSAFEVAHGGGFLELAGLNSIFLHRLEGLNDRVEFPTEEAHGRSQ